MLTTSSCCDILWKPSYCSITTILSAVYLEAVMGLAVSNYWGMYSKFIMKSEIALLWTIVTTQEELGHVVFQENCLHTQNRVTAQERKVALWTLFAKKHLIPFVACICGCTIFVHWFTNIAQVFLSTSEVSVCKKWVQLGCVKDPKLNGY